MILFLKKTGHLVWHLFCFKILKLGWMILYKPVIKYSRTMLVKLQCAYESPGDTVKMQGVFKHFGVGTGTPHF